MTIEKKKFVVTTYEVYAHFTSEEIEALKTVKSLMSDIANPENYPTIERPAWARDWETVGCEIEDIINELHQNRGTALLYDDTVEEEA